MALITYSIEIQGFKEFIFALMEKNRLLETFHNIAKLLFMPDWLPHREKLKNSDKKDERFRKKKEKNSLACL